MNAMYERYKETFKASAKRRWKRMRTAVLAAYGGKCVCCGEAEEVFLCLDHLNNDGAAHRKKMTNGPGVYADVIKQGFPGTFQILCYNCNNAKAKIKHCPHKEI